NLARALFDDLSVNESRRLAGDERTRGQELVGRLRRLDERISAALTQVERLEDFRLDCEAGLSLLPALSGPPALSAPSSAVLLVKQRLASDSLNVYRGKLGELK